MRYGGKYEDWFLLVEISSVLLGGVCSIQLSYRDIIFKFFLIVHAKRKNVNAYREKMRKALAFFLIRAYNTKVSAEKIKRYRIQP